MRYVCPALTGVAGSHHHQRMDMRVICPLLGVPRHLHSAPVPPHTPLDFPVHQKPSKTFKHMRQRAAQLVRLCILDSQCQETRHQPRMVLVHPVQRGRKPRIVRPRPPPLTHRAKPHPAVKQSYKPRFSRSLVSSRHRSKPTGAKPLSLLLIPRQLCRISKLEIFLFMARHSLYRVELSLLIFQDFCGII